MINGVTEVTRALQERRVVYGPAGSRRKRILRESDVSVDGSVNSSQSEKMKGRKGQTQEEQQESRNTMTFKTGPTALCLDCKGELCTTVA